MGPPLSAYQPGTNVLAGAEGPRTGRVRQEDHLDEVPLHQTRAADRETVAWLCRRPREVGWFAPRGAWLLAPHRSDDADLWFQPAFHADHGLGELELRPGAAVGATARAGLSSFLARPNLG